MQRVRFCLVLFCVQMAVLACWAQNTYVVRDLRAILELSVSKGFAKKWEIELGAKTIIQKDISQPGEYDITTGLSYTPIKAVTTGIKYQWSKNLKKNGTYETGHRWAGFVTINKKIDKLKIEYRTGYQNTDDEWLMDEEGTAAKQIIRNRLYLKYNLKKSKFTPFTYFEHYGQLENETPYGVKIKWAAGTTFSFNKHHAIKGEYRIDHQLNADYPYTYHNLCLGYAFKF